MNKLWYGVGLVLGLIILVVGQVSGEKLQIVACNVGQGDGILIIKGQSQVLVDGGPSGEKILSCLGEQMPFYDRQIELIVLTNTDYDHMNGLSSVIERYQVRQFVTADGVHESAALDKLRARLVERSIGVSAVEQGDMLRILGQDKIELKVLWPPEVEEQYVAVFGDQVGAEERQQILGASAKRGNLNERSVVLLLLEDNYRALLMGDAGFQAEKELIEGGLLVDVDYLKVGHHGSKYATSAEFLAIVKPEVAVISVGENNRYGHPTEEVLARLDEVGAEIRRTDEEGEVVIASDWPN